MSSLLLLPLVAASVIPVPRIAPVANPPPNPPPPRGNKLAVVDSKARASKLFFNDLHFELLF